MEKNETRSLERITSDGEMEIEGYALKFNSLSEDLGGFREIILDGALDNVDLSDVRCLINHDGNLCIGRTKANTLELAVDEVGLRFKCKLPETSFARDLYSNIKLGNVDQCSFKFALQKGGEGWKRDKNGGRIRSIKNFLKIDEISVVTFPAYESTNVAVAVRNMEKEDEFKKNLLLFEIDLLEDFI